MFKAVIEMGALLVYAISFLSCTTLAFAQKLRFNSPDFGAVSGTGLPYFTEGQDIKLSWSTSFESTTLSVLQSPEDKIYRIHIIAGTFTR